MAAGRAAGLQVRKVRMVVTKDMYTRAQSFSRAHKPGAPGAHAAVDVGIIHHRAAAMVQAMLRGRRARLLVALLDRRVQRPLPPRMNLLLSVPRLATIVHEAQQKMILSGQAGMASAVVIKASVREDRHVRLSTIGPGHEPVRSPAIPELTARPSRLGPVRTRSGAQLLRKS